MRRRLLRGALALVVGNLAFTAWASTACGPAAPRIGVVVSEAWFDVAGFNPSAYELALVRAGANAVRRRPGDPLDGLDGLVLIGGGDVDLLRDAAELEMIREAERRDLPVLAICRGAQVLAAAYGGRLGELPGHFLTLHPVGLEAGSRAAEIYGRTALTVSSTHRMSITDPGRLRATAWGEGGVIEALELPGPRFVLGLQWHPEWEGLASADRLAPFQALAAATKRTG